MNGIIGLVLGLWLMFIINILLDSQTDNTKIVYSEYKPIIDYKLKGNGKQIDTIWIYTFKKH